MLDLNQATASLKVTEPHTRMPVASAMSVAMLSICALYIFKPAAFTKATNHAKSAVRNMLMYTLTDRRAAPGILKERKGTPWRLPNATKPRSRRDFSLSSSLAAAAWWFHHVWILLQQWTTH